MKKQLKIFFLALLLGGITTYYYFSHFDNTIIAKALSPKITIFMVGTYNDYETASLKKEEYSEALIYEENDLYKVIIGAYHNEDVIALMRSYFKDQDYIFSEEQIKISNEFINAGANYENLIKTSASSYYESLNNSLLDLFLRYIK